MSDRPTLAHAIEDAGIERAKADRVASAIVDLIHDEVATRVDVAAVGSDLRMTEAVLRAGITALATELHRTGVTLKADIAAACADLHATESRLKGEIALIEHRLLTRLTGLIVVALGLLFVALHYWPPLGRG
jgi:hypothetical protein